jgi:hypothetical protein
MLRPCVHEPIVPSSSLPSLETQPVAAAACVNEPSAWTSRIAIRDPEPDT